MISAATAVMPERAPTNRIAYLIIVMIGLAFGFWFAQQQLLAVSADAFATFPKMYYCLTAIKCLFTILTFFGFSYLALLHFSNRKLGARFVAYSFLPLLLTYAHCPLLIIFGLMVTIQFSGLLMVWNKKDYTWLFTQYSVDLTALFVLFMLHLMLTSQYSPLHWRWALFTKPGGVSEEIPVQAPIYKGYSLSKQYVFSTMDYSEWASVLNPTVTLASPLSQLTALTIDLPSINPIDFHRLLSAINFLLIVGGSFGCYLFLRYATKVSVVFALLGGCLMFFGASHFLYLMLTCDGGIFMSSYAIFPFAMLFLSLACEKRSYLLAMWAGVALASQFFIFSPHPEGIIYSGFFLGIYAIGLILFSPFSTWQQRILLSSVAFTAFLLLSTYVVAPLIVDEITGMAHTFAHTDLNVNSMEYLHRYEKLFAIFIPLAFIFLKYKRIYPAYAPALFFCLFLSALYLATNYMAFVSALINILHVGVHIWVPWRTGLFVCLSIIIVSIICLEILTSKALQFILYLARE